MTFRQHWDLAHLRKHIEHMESEMNNPRPWFKAKTYGWGWGLPLTWQGWLAYACYFALVVASAFLFPPNRDPADFAFALIGVNAALIGLCFLKGEEPRWRWGE